MRESFQPPPLATINPAMIQSLYLGRLDYGEALALQAEIAAHVADGRTQNVLLLLEHPPVLTLGRNADRAHILASSELLARRGIAIHEINRGGDVTYHGPGQLIGYPIFDLRTLTAASGRRMGPVDFVRLIEEALIRLSIGYGVRAGRIRGLTGVWCGSTGNREQGSGISSMTGENMHNQTDSVESARKIAAIGIHVARGITTHGFAFNLSTDLDDFSLIVPCGIKDYAVTSLAREVESTQCLPTLEELAHHTARCFGQVFNQQILAVESQAALRTQAESAVPQPAEQEFPAQDTPLQIPAEVARLMGRSRRPQRA